MLLKHPIDLARLGIAFVRLVRDPNQLEQVFKLADLSDPALDARMITQMEARGFGQVLAARRRLGPVDLPTLSSYPAGSLASVFAAHMQKANLDPAAIPTLNAPSAIRYMQAHLYETHDLWHAATGFGVDIAGELGLQGFYAAQNDDPFPVALITAGLLNTLLFAFDDARPRLQAITEGWCLGRAARPLFGYPWQDRWSTPIAEVRAELGLPTDGVQLARADLPLAA